MSIKNSLEVIRDGVSSVLPLFHWDDGSSEMLNYSFNGCYDGVGKDIRLRLWRKGRIVFDLDWKELYKDVDGHLMLDGGAFVPGTPASIYVLAGEVKDWDGGFVGLSWRIKFKIYTKIWGGRVYIESGRFKEMRNEDTDAMD